MLLKRLVKCVLQSKASSSAFTSLPHFTSMQAPKCWLMHLLLIYTLFTSTFGCKCLFVGMYVRLLLTSTAWLHEVACCTVDLVSDRCAFASVLPSACDVLNFEFNEI
jgi:hypothetical protein